MFRWYQCESTGAAGGRGETVLDATEFTERPRLATRSEQNHGQRRARTDGPPSRQSGTKLTLRQVRPVNIPAMSWAALSRHQMGRRGEATGEAKSDARTAVAGHGPNDVADQVVGGLMS